ncbi:unnamed protein product [Parnassius apollo]|uniref:(apollo) hypothetical protein n=1 Tax=Parnassius apollo TaxID=110799 RepID=A0A8S3XGS2_PARAO|nr:unnamed protein product [Parnassius apollo]
MSENENDDKYDVSSSCESEDDHGNDMPPETNDWVIVNLISMKNLVHRYVGQIHSVTDSDEKRHNYMKYKMGFSRKILLADETVSTKFYCQEDRKRRLSDAGPSGKVFLKRQRVNLVTKCLQTQRTTEVHTACLQNDDDMIQQIIELIEAPKLKTKKQSPTLL